MTAGDIIVLIFLLLCLVAISATKREKMTEVGRLWGELRDHNEAGVIAWRERSWQAEAKLAKLVEVLDRVLTEAGIQAHKVGCPNKLMRLRLSSSTNNPCPACDAEAALAAAKGEK